MTSVKVFDNPEPKKKRAANTSMLLGLLVAFLMFGLSGLATAQTGSGTTVDPVSDLASVALQNQESVCGASLQVEFTSDWQKIGTGSAVVEQDHQNCRYVRTPQGFRLEKLKDQGDQEIASYDRSTGERRMFHQINNIRTGEVSQGSKEPIAAFELPDPVHYPLYEGPLCDYIEFGTSSAGTESIDGYDCRRIEIPTQRSNLDKYIVWVDQTIGFSPRRIEFVWNDKQPTIVSFTDYADLGGGVWFPKKETLSYGSRFLKDNTFSIVNSITTVSKGQTVPLTDITVQFPSGTKVYDAALDAEYTAN